MDLLIRSENVLYINDLNDRDSVLNYISDEMIGRGFVKSSFKEAIINRENMYPTALPFEDFAVAIPHTDAIHVNQNQIMIAILNEGVNFTVMGSENESAQVKIVFMLAVNNYENYLTFLKNFITVFQEKGVLKELYNKKNEIDFALEFNNLFENIEG